MTWNQLNITLYQQQLEVMGSLSKRSSMPIGIGVPEKLGEKVDLRCLGLSGWINLN